jgi:hypothetical protein
VCPKKTNQGDNVDKTLAWFMRMWGALVDSAMQGHVCNYLGGHRANLLLHGAKWIGIAHAQNGRRMYWALVIGGEMKGHRRQLFLFNLFYSHYSVFAFGGK